MNTPSKKCPTCKGGMSFASRPINTRVKVTGWHCPFCATVTERFGILDVVRSA